MGLSSISMGVFKSLFNAFWGLFSYTYTLSVTVLTLWMALPKMFYNWYRMCLSRDQLWNCKQAGTKAGPDQLGPPVRVRINSDRLGTTRIE